MTAYPDVELIEAEKIIEAGRALTGRSCGDCSMCCKLLKIEEDEINKPANQWCKHCRPGAGCTIYNDRPLVCRAFCLWLVGKPGTERGVEAFAM